MGNVSNQINETLEKIDTVDKAEIRSFVPEQGRRERIRKEVALLKGKPIHGLRGMLVGVKDIIAVDGLPTRAGSALDPGTIQLPENPAVTKLRAAGAIKDTNE